jgi:hypothetical protein
MGTLKMNWMIVTAMMAASAQAQEAPTAQQDELTARQAEINKLFDSALAKERYLRENAHKCTKNHEELKKTLLNRMKEKLGAARTDFNSELAALNANIKSQPASFKDVNACQGYKSGAIADFSGKKATIKKTQAKLEGKVARKLEEEVAKLKQTPDDWRAKLGGYETTHAVVVAAFEKTGQYPTCPTDTVAVFNGVAHPNSPNATISQIVAKTRGLDSALSQRSASLDKSIAEINKLDCGNAVAADAAKKLETGKKDEIKVAGADAPPKQPTAQELRDEAAKKDGNTGVKPASTALPVAQKDPNKILEEKLNKPNSGESPPLVTDANRKNFEGAQNKKVVPDPLPITPVEAAPKPQAGSTGSTNVVGDILKEQQKIQASTLENSATVSEPPAIPERKPASIAQTYSTEPLSPSDKWAAPSSWKAYDDYKVAISAPNKITDPNLGQYYGNFLSSNSVRVSTEEDALRLQKAINATSMQVNGVDSTRGISVYQDGLVGSRTMSAVYMMQNDPAYRDVFLANLRRQGLIQ